MKRSTYTVTASLLLLLLLPFLMLVPLTEADPCIDNFEIKDCKTIIGNDPGGTLEKLDPTTIDWSTFDPATATHYRELDPSQIDWSKFDPAVHDPSILLGFISIEDIVLPGVSQESLQGYIGTLGDIWEELRKGNGLAVASFVLDPLGSDPLTLEFGPVCGSGVSAYLIPDKVGRADFTPACREHDQCYVEQLGQRKCDKQFKAHLYRRCEYAYPGVLVPLQAKCRAIAETYFQAVRVAGKNAYDDASLNISLGLPKKCINNFSLVDCKSIIGDPAELRKKLQIRLKTYPFCIVDTNESGIKSYETCESPIGGSVGELMCRGLANIGWDFHQEEVVPPESTEPEGTRREILYGRCDEHLNEIFSSEPSAAVETPTVPDVKIEVNEGESQITGEITADDFREPILNRIVKTQFTFNGPGFVKLIDNGDSSASLILTPGYDDAGEHVGVIAVRMEGVEKSLRIPITVNNVNRSPSIDPISLSSINEGQQAIYEVIATDPDGQVVEFNLETDAPFVSLVDNADGTARLTLQPDYEAAAFPYRQYSLAVQVSDPEGGSDRIVTDFVVNNVNRAPELNLAERSTILISEGTRSVQLIQPSDPDGQVVELEIFGQPYFSRIIRTDGGPTEVYISPGYRDKGNYSLIVTATDPEGARDVAQLDLVVINELQPLESHSQEYLPEGDLGVIELRVPSWPLETEAQVQILTEDGWQNVRNGNNDKAWNQSLDMLNPTARFTYGTNALRGTYRWVIHDVSEGHGEGWASSAPFYLGESFMHLVTVVSLRE